MPDGNVSIYAFSFGQMAFGFPCFWSATVYSTAPQKARLQCLMFWFLKHNPELL